MRPSIIALEMKHSQILHLVFVFFVLFSIVNWALGRCLDHGNSSLLRLVLPKETRPANKNPSTLLISLQILTTKVERQGSTQTKNVVLYHRPLIRSSYGISTFWIGKFSVNGPCSVVRLVRDPGCVRCRAGPVGSDPASQWLGIALPEVTQLDSKRCILLLSQSLG